ncbi:hypothetical protein [Desulfovibrio gilichinskyi]|uniref:Uncharacterized protein n=1 Tax=Desulfovibrio gilichinskyi TaxID=1519643 RepID=A0A1X7C3M6_9BACT|nr:hypothetical protein [Desulfovibrio gilichinskyi]SME89426.1 hypothetical protein SAMN06295933_0299 [Desulfovibrio gilichinskyi]
MAVSLTLTPTLGVDKSASAANIADAALSRGYNVYYDPGTSKLTTRPGFKCATATPLTGGIDALHHFGGMIGTTPFSFLMCVSYGKLWKLNGIAWEEVATLNSADIIPQMVTFNSKLIIADGADDGLKSYDGTAVTTILESPANPTAVKEVSNRLVANSTTTPDYIFLSAAEQFDKWSAADGGYKIPAGYGDGLSVNGFASLHNKLVVSKLSSNEKRLYGVNMEGDASAWSTIALSSENAALGPHAIKSLGSSVCYIDTDGFAKLNPTDTYGDVAVDSEVGFMMGSDFRRFSKNASNVSLTWVASLGALAIIFTGNGLKEFHLFNPRHGFTQWESSDFKALNCVCELDGKIYLGGVSGYLYEMHTAGTDEVEPDNVLPLWGVARFKLYESATGKDLFLESGSKVNVDYVTSGQYNFEVYAGNAENKVLLQTFNTVSGSGQQELYDADTDIVDATYGLDSSTTGQDVCRSKFRGKGLMFQIRTHSGCRVAINSINAMVREV